MTRFRQGGWVSDTGVTTTYCTIDSGDGDPQTTVIFRCSEDACDVTRICRPFPNSMKASYDSCQFSEYKL